MPSINFGSTNTAALAEYMVKKYNLVGRDAAYMKNRPTLMAVPRDQEKLKQGDGFFETVKIAGGWSGLPGWVDGNANHNPSQKVRWQVGDPYAQYGYLSIDTLLLQRNNVGTLLDVKGAEADDVSNSMLDTTEFELWNDGTASRGQILTNGGSAATRVWTLVTASDVYNFPINAVLTANTVADGSGTQRADVYKVIDIDPVGGTVTGSRISGAGADVAANDFLHFKNSANLYMPGIPKFIPASAPADVLYGVTRTANPALSGWRFPFKASISETISRAFTMMGRWVNRSAQRFVCVLSSTDWLLLSFERESRVVPDPAAVQKWGLEGLVVRTGFGPITCIAIPQLPDGRGYIIDWSTWRLYTLRNLPHVIDEDGQMFVRGREGTPDTNANGDFIKMQFRMWKALLCLMPMANATFPTK